jgi:hypothetical protein
MFTEVQFIKILIMKNLKNLGKALSKAEQRSINGGRRHCSVGCPQNSPCCSDDYCLDKLNDNPDLPGRQCVVFL